MPEALKTEDFELLSDDAIVAFSARTALRVFPAFASSYEFRRMNDYMKFITTVENSIAIAIGSSFKNIRSERLLRIAIEKSSLVVNEALARADAADNAYARSEIEVSNYSLKAIEAISTAACARAAASSKEALNSALSFITKRSKTLIATSATLSTKAAISATKAAIKTVSWNSSGAIQQNLHNLDEILRQDYEYLKNLKQETSPKALKGFYQRALWEGVGLSKEWEKIEENFQQSLMQLGNSDVFNRYRSGGIVYEHYNSIDPKVNDEFRNTEEATFVASEFSKEDSLDSSTLGTFNKDDTIESKNEDTIESTSSEIGINMSKKMRFLGNPMLSSIQSNSLPPTIELRKQAKVFTEIINELQQEQGQFVGIFGQWGRGKTFLWELIKTLLTSKKSKSKENQFITETFHAWKYQDTPASWAYLYEILSKRYLNKPKPLSIWPYKSIRQMFNEFVFFPFRWLNYLFRQLQLHLNRGKLDHLFLTTIGAIFLAFSVGFISEVNSSIEWMSKLVPGALLIPIVTLISQLTKKEYSTKAVDLFKKVTEHVSFEQHMGTQAEIQKELTTLLKVWFPIKKLGKLPSVRLVLFIDDIDRCEEKRIIPIVDALRVMLEDTEIQKRMIIVAAVDERILSRAIKNKYHCLVEKHCCKDNISHMLNTLSREYFDKLFIAGLKLPMLEDKEKGEIIKSLLDSSSINEEDVLEEVRVLGSDDFDEVKYEDLKEDQINEKLSSDIKLSPDSKTQDQITILDDDKNGINDNIIDDALETTDNFTGYYNEKEYSLEQYEAKVLKEVGTLIPCATPRQLRIWFYRYQLAMKLLAILNNSNKYTTGEISLNLEKYSKLVALFLAEYGICQELGNLSNGKQDCLAQAKTNTPEITIEFFENNYKHSIPNEKDFEQFCEYLFTVLEMVIAY